MDLVTLAFEEPQHAAELEVARSRGLRGELHSHGIAVVPVAPSLFTTHVGVEPDKSKRWTSA